VRRAPSTASRTRRTGLAVFLASTVIHGASDASDAPPSAASRVDAASSADTLPSLTAMDRAALATMAPARLPAPPADPTNAHADDPAAAALGQALFFTPVFAGPLLDGDNDGGAHALGKKGEPGRVACAGCHVPTSDFGDTRSPSAQISLGSGWGRRRAPSLLDVGQAKLVMWDGRRDTLYDQVFAPIESPVEMNSSRLYVAEQVFWQFKAQYERVFGRLPPLDDAARFPRLPAATNGCHPSGPTPGQMCGAMGSGYPGDHAQFDSMTRTDQEAVTRVVVNVGKAIGAYERRLTCGPSRFDRWVHGDAVALSPSEQRGAKVFMGPGDCNRCHSGPFFSDQAFHNVGLVPAVVASAFIDAGDRGALEGVALALADPLNSRGLYSDGSDDRLPRSVPPTWEGSFRTPMLRCASRRPSFFHTGQARSLEGVIDFFDRGGSPFAAGVREIAPLHLTPTQRRDLLAFLKALDGPGAATELTAPPASLGDAKAPSTR
jgi:cytochrome c peroxidase